MKLKEYWIGLNDKAEEGKWKWESGTAIGNNWGGWKKPNEPNNKGNEDCATVCWSGKEVCDINCGEKRPTMCQRETETQTQTVDLSPWKIYHSSIRVTYEQAKEQCSIIGARLVDEHADYMSRVRFLSENIALRYYLIK